MGEGELVWSLDEGIVTLPFFQLMEGFAASNQGCLSMVFSFPLLMM